MPKNFGTNSSGDGAEQPVTRHVVPAGLGSKLAERSIAIAVGLALVAGLGTLTVVMYGDSAHQSTLAAYAKEYETAHAQRTALEGETAPSSTDVAKVYERIAELAEPITAFESGTGEYKAAEEVCPGLSAALWYHGDMDGVTVAFSPSYQVSGNSYPCAWFVWEGDTLLAYAFADFDAESETFVITDQNLTFDGSKKVSEQVDPVDVTPEAPTDDTSSDEDAESDQPVEDPALRESDAAQSGVNADGPEE